MRMNEIQIAGRPPIDGYGPGGFRVDEIWLEGSLILTPGGRHRFSAPLDVDALAPVLAEADAIDVVLIGQGADIAPLAPALRQSLERAEIGVEVMSTPSACRTYNVLLTEDRRVAVILTAL